MKFAEPSTENAPPATFRNRANRAKPKQEAPPCAFRPHPTRQDGLKDEIKHMLTKETAERKSQYQVCPRFNDYLSAIQVGSQVNVTHRRTIFEWNLKLADNDLRLSNQALHYTFTFFGASRAAFVP